MHRIEKYLFDHKLITEDQKQKLFDEALEKAKKAYEESTEDLEKEGYEDIFK